MWKTRKAALVLVLVLELGEEEGGGRGPLRGASYAAPSRESVGRVRWPESWCSGFGRCGDAGIASVTVVPVVGGGALEAAAAVVVVNDSSAE